MNSRRYMLSCCLAFLLFSSSLIAQQTVASESAVVPRLVNFSGRAVAEGKIVSGVAGVTFAIYQEQSGGTPLWIETQNIQADAKGNYTAQLGATKPEGLPLDLFTSGAARWLGVTVNGAEEQPRILLLSVPYALKAADAQTLGGLPASAFVLAAPPVAGEASSGSVTPSAPSAVAASLAAPPPASSDVTTTGGTVNALPLFSTATNIQNSLVTQTGTTGINVAGALRLPATGAATATAGKNSQPEMFIASAFYKTTNAATAETFLWQAEPFGNDTTAPTATLNLLFASGTGAPAETGLRIGPKGGITFVPGQNFPIANAAVTNAMLAHPSLAVNAGIGLTGGGTVPLGGATTLNLNPTEVPLLASANLFTNNQAISASASTWGLTVSQPSYQTIMEQGPESGIGTALEMQTTGTGGMSWQILNTGALASQGPNVLNFRNDSAGLDVMTMTASGQVGIGTHSPTATLDVQGDAVQPVTAGGFVKAMVYVNAITPPYKILRCFNSTLTGAAATTVPCGINFTEAGVGIWDFAFNFEVDNRFYGATLAAVVNLAPGIGSCIGAGSISSDTVEVDTSDCNSNGKSADFSLVIY